MFFSLRQRVENDIIFKINDFNYDLYCFWKIARDRNKELIKSVQAIKVILKAIYRDKYGNLTIPQLREKVLIKKMKNLVGRGFLSYGTLLPFFPRFSNKEILEHYFGNCNCRIRKIIKSIYLPRAHDLIKFYERNNILYDKIKLIKDLNLHYADATLESKAAVDKIFILKFLRF